MAININKSLGDFHLLICPKPGPYWDELPAKALDNHLAYQAGELDQLINTFGGDQVILVESPPGWNKLFILLKLDKCTSLRHVVNVVIVHGVTEASCGVYCADWRGVWTRENYQYHWQQYDKKLAKKFHGKGQEE
jgi:hypothetical protein